jgi:rhodanese-related sulfurtransferase
MADLTTVSPERAAELVRAGAVLVDVRDTDEYAREHIPGARHHALTRIGHDGPTQSGGDVLIFHCRSGARTKGNAARLAAAAQDCEVYLLEGGLDAWKKAGLPVALDRSQPIDILRQMQITAGSLALLGVVLGTWVNPNFYALSAFIGAGLVFAGISGICPMVRLLQRMPWNRRAMSPAE